MSAKQSLGRLVRGALAAVAVVIIVLALGIGVLRIAATQLPGYQAQIERALGDALGLELGFERMDARFGLRGPELTFHAATVAAPGEAEPFLSARRAAVVIDAWTLITERDLRAKRLTLDGTTLTLLRRDDGRLALERAPEGEGVGNVALLLPPELEVAVRASTVRYVDAKRGVDWTFEDFAVDLRRGGGLIQLDARAKPPASVATRLEVAVQGDSRRGGGWRIFGSASGADLASIGLALPDWRGWPLQGRGEATVWLEWREGVFMRGMVDGDFAGLAWAAGGEHAAYDRAALSGEWTRTDDGWRLVLNDVEIVRGERRWPRDADAVIDAALDEAGPSHVSMQASFVRLDDLTPIVAAAGLDAAWADRWLELAPRGDLSDLALEWQRSAEGFLYDLSARFEALGIHAVGGHPGFDGLSGEIRADSNSGRVRLATRAARLDWRALFRDVLDVDELAGVLVWREGADVLRLVSDDLVLATPDVRTRSSLELTIPLDGGSPSLDLTTEADGFEVVAAKRYFPARKMPRRAVEWLDGALRGGQVTRARLEFVGPLAAFPFDAGEGVFRVTADVENGILRYVGDWPEGRELEATLEFHNAAFRAHGRGRVLRNVGDGVTVEIADLRRPVLTMTADTRGPLEDVLEFLHASPPIAVRLGPGHERLVARTGIGSVSFDLHLPLLDMAAYQLDAKLGLESGEFAIQGFPAPVTDVNGVLELSDGVVTARGIEATFLDGPVTANVSPTDQEGYRARLDFGGEVAATAVADVFGLPFRDVVAGQTRWAGSLLLPATPADAAAPSSPLRVAINSNLSGVALNFPEPFRKPAADPTNLKLDFAIDAERVDVTGHLGANRRAVMAFRPGDDGFELKQGAVTFGGDGPPERAEPGLGVYGSLPRLDVDAWLALIRPTGGRARERDEFAAGLLGGAFTEAQLEVSDFAAFGQHVGAAQLDVRRDDQEWRIQIEAHPVAGTVRVPRNVDGRPRIVADMSRLYLSASDSGGRGAGHREAAAGVHMDPRRVPGLELTAEEFVFGTRRFGALRADVRPHPSGLEVVSFESRADAFTVSGSGGWHEGTHGAQTRLAFTLNATDVAGALRALSLEPVAAGAKAEIKASVAWPGAPMGPWMNHLGGELSLRLERGSLLDIDPGAGRVVGLMSITALPRRLALDFRDVFNRGFVFDQLGGDFTILDGNAYTDNLKVSGPSAEIGVAGRIGLRDRDYRQQAVVTAEPGNMLPTVGGLIGGPGVGAALLIFTRIFKEPLKGIGRASYCITGSWDAPAVDRLTAEEIEQGRLCADLPGQGFVSIGEGR